MMNYEEFKKIVEEEIKDYLPEEFQKMEFIMHPVKKVNCILDGMTIRSSEKTVAPTLYLNDMYKHYQQDENMDDVLQAAIAKIKKAVKEAPNAISLDLDKAKDNIVFQLVNTEQNKEMLPEIPHRDYHDLSIIYRWIVKTEEKGHASIIIQNNLAEQIGMTEEQLFKAAVENTRRIFPPEVKPIKDIMRKMQMKNDIPFSFASEYDLEILDMIPEEDMLWVISNEQHINGAAIMLYEDKLYELAQKLGSNLYILPSSVHEVMAISSNKGDPDEFAQMVTEINMWQVAPEERLSNQVYYYDKDLRKVTLATNTPFKRLDGFVVQMK